MQIVMQARHQRPALVAVALACTVLGQSPSFLSRAQQENGRWPAAEFGGVPEADLRVNALLLLAHLADGSTTREGPRRDQVSRSLAWLQSQQDAEGRFLLRADPTWLLDHAMATYAVAEAMRLTGRFDPAELDCVTRAIGALCRQLATSRPVPSNELRVWCRMIEGSLRVALESPPPELLHKLAEDLTKAVAGLPPFEPATPRERAAALLLQDLSASPPSREEVASVEWPANPLEDPLATFYQLLVAFRQGGPAFTEAREYINKGVMKTQHRVQRQEVHGTWDPVGAFGDENGRLGTTVGAILLMQIHYRYSRLSVVL
jgi:hypothetical protein